MKLIKTEDAVGCMLCHDITQIIPGVVKDAVFRKGHVVTREDIPVLLSVGKEHLYVWEKQEGMLHEDEAAEILRSVCQNAQMDASKPKEGKIELTAQCDGVLKVDKEKLCRINAMGQMCISSRHGNFPVKNGDKIAGMRVIPLVIEEEKMKQVKEIAGETPVFALLPFQKKKAAIVTTGSEVYHGRIQDKFTPVVRQKLEEYGVEVLGNTICNDEPDMVTEAVNDWIKKGAQMVVCTGGMSVDPDVQEFTLSCDASLGTISSDGKKFYASPNATSGYLHVTSGTTTGKIKVTVKEADIVMKNSEIIADKAHPYSLEVISHIGENTFTYDPSSLSWSIEDPTVCKIENGILTGIKNGTTNITGSIGNFSGNMKVTVEIPESPKIPADDFSGWTTKSISSITDATVTPSGNNQAILGFTYKTGRLPYVEMDKAITLYSIPDTLRMLINSEIPVSKIQIACKANGDKEQYLEFEGITVNEDYLISIPLSDITGENNRGGFPVSLNYIKFYINTTGTISGQAYKIHIKEFSLVYNGIESGIDETVTGNKNMVVYPNPITGNTLFLQGENIVPGSSIRIYDRVGALILEQLLDETGIVNIGDQQPGVYIVNVQNELGTHVCKIVIQ